MIRQTYILSSNDKFMLSTTKFVKMKSNSTGVSVAVLRERVCFCRLILTPSQLL